MIASGEKRKALREEMRTVAKTMEETGEDISNEWMPYFI